MTGLCKNRTLITSRLLMNCIQIPCLLITLDSIQCRIMPKWHQIILGLFSHHAHIVPTSGVNSHLSTVNSRSEASASSSRHSAQSTDGWRVLAGCGNSEERWYLSFLHMVRPCLSIYRSQSIALGCHGNPHERATEHGER